MTKEEALARAICLNDSGKHRADWIYYATCHDGGSIGKDSPHYGQWFVMRRPRGTQVKVAVFANGKLSISEK